MRPALTKWLDRARRAALVAGLLAGAALLLDSVHEHYPIQHWLFWRYATYWLCCLAFSAASLSLGHILLAGVADDSLERLEHWALAFPLGVLGFELVIYLGGVAQLYGDWFFFVAPLLCIAAGAKPTLRWLRPQLHPLKYTLVSTTPWQLAIMLFGFAALGMIYFILLTPDNVPFDARWMHLVVAEDYVAHGGLRRFGEGYLFAAAPHFGSFLYTWAFMLPGSILFDRMELAQHLEFTVFLWVTLTGIPALVRRLVPSANPRLVWVARFLFPGVFLYDSSLGGGADHLAAMYAIPVFLVSLRAWRQLSPRWCLLLGGLLAGAAMTKYTLALMLIPMPALMVSVRALMLAWRRLRGRLPREVTANIWLGPLAAGIAGVVTSAPHWLKNVIWYGDPFYPMLNRWFSPRPWTQSASYTYRWGFVESQSWKPTRDLDGVLETIKALFTFSFDPNDWPRFHGEVPVIGFLFTLLLIALPFLKRTKRIWLLVAWVHVAIFIWYWVHHQDRYLQAIMPLMASSTAAIIVLVWQQGKSLVRAALAMLIGLQVVWGGDVYFIPTHAMTRSPQKRVLDLLAAGYGKKYEDRFSIQEQFVNVGKRLPEGARVVMHEQHNMLGTEATTISDWATWQYGLDYGSLGSPKAVYETLRGLGATHLYWVESSRGWDTVAGDIVFHAFANRYTTNPMKVGSAHLAALEDAAPTGSFGQVAVLGCRGGYAPGLYTLEDLRVPVFGPDAENYPKPRKSAASKDDAMELLADADFAVRDPKCGYATGSLQRGFTKVATRRRAPGSKAPKYEIWIRKSDR